MNMTEDTSLEEVRRGLSELTLLSFRKVDEVKRLARHFKYVIDNPKTQENAIVLRYLRDLDETHRKIFFTPRDGVEVEYIFTTEKKSSLQRQRFNSLPVSEVPELLKAELTIENAKQVHICMDCDVEIEINDDVPLMECLQRHFNLDVHQPKLKRESIDVAEPIILPNMSRRLSALECGETPSQNIDYIQIAKPMEKLDKMFSGKLEASLIRHLPDNSEASIDSAVKFYQGVYDKLCQEINGIDFTGQTSSVAPIIMSIKDNVNQTFESNANKNYDGEETDQVPDRPVKSQAKKYRYYGSIECLIVKLLTNHKLLTLVDDRTGKLAFFCMACEYYTLRFKYDSVLNHVFSETHIHNLACILQADRHIPFTVPEPSVDKIRDMNRKFLMNHSVHEASNGWFCSLCKYNVDSNDSIVLHVLDENHLARLSDKLYHKMKANNPDGSVPDEWGPKSYDWAKFLASVGKPLNNRDHVVIENFIKPGKVSNYCSCCDMVLKGPRQVLFNHIRQKKHLRNAAPHKLALLYKNHCRPAEYYASFGNYYVCTVCPAYVALPSFSAIVEHFESSMHVETIAKFICAALYPNGDRKLLESNDVVDNKCVLCDACFEDARAAVRHVLCDVGHQSCVAEARTRANRGDIISVYLHGNYVLHSDGAQFTCTVCGNVFNSIRSLLNHLVFAEHFKQKPNAENVFRFYLELKHNINMLSRNKYAYYDVGRLRCGVCACDVGVDGDGDVDVGENAKRHVTSPRHKENMGASYVNVNLDASVE